MENMTGFGLASVKREGSTVLVDKEQGMKLAMEQDNAISKTRWIELCFDPEESTARVDVALDSIYQCIDDSVLISPAGLTEDDIYLMVKSIANKYLPEGSI